MVYMKEYHVEANSEKMTSTIQAAIDACAEDGGGRVVLTGGTYECGTLFLRSHVICRLKRVRFFRCLMIFRIFRISPANGMSPKRPGTVRAVFFTLEIAKMCPSADLVSLTAAARHTVRSIPMPHNQTAILSYAIG